MKRSEAFLGGAVALLGAAVFLHSMSFPPQQGGWPGPGLFPQILAVLLVCFGGAVTVQAVRSTNTAVVSYEPAAMLKAAVILVAIAIYITVVQRVGFLITASVVTGGLMLLLGVKIRIAVPAGIGVAVLCVVLFERVLRVPLPPGILGG
jgi:putative tricarboxylic transport membrane protein